MGEPWQEKLVNHREREGSDLQPKVNNKANKRGGLLWFYGLSWQFAFTRYLKLTTSAAEFAQNESSKLEIDLFTDVFFSYNRPLVIHVDAIF